jgi:hypothetical protein
LTIDPHEVPKKGVLKSKHKTIADVVSPMDQLVFVSSRVKDIWEAHAPGQVEFIPLELVRKNGTRVSDRDYYFFNIPNQIEALDYANSDLIVEKGRSGFGYRYIKLHPFWFAPDQPKSSP